MISGLFRYRVRSDFRWKKPRGVLRKANRILREAEAFNVREAFDSETWSDWGHTHLDWDGIGNYSPEIRILMLEAHAKVFRAYARQCQNIGKPFHLFFSLFKEDAGQDAVYLHTPNPNSGFPGEFDNLKRRVPQLEALLTKLLPEFRFVAGDGGYNYNVWAQDVGVPLRETGPW